MTIEDSDQVDFVAVYPGEGDIVLVISDHLDWEDPEDHARLLQSKIYRYLDFVESGELCERFPAVQGRGVCIQVRAKFPGTEYSPAQSTPCDSWPTSHHSSQSQA